jgi:hypothetical protein
VAAAAALIAVLGGTAAGSAATAEAPAVLSVDDASEVSFTTAKVSGSVERAGDPDPASDASCEFEYVTDAVFRGTGFKKAVKVPCEPDPITVPGPNTVSAELTGLKPGAEYHLRLTASNAGGSDSLEAADTFTTTAIASPAVTIDPPGAVTPTSAHFSGTVDPQLGPGDPSLYEVKWHFQCTPECLGPDGQPISGAPIPPDNSVHTVQGDAVLEPNTAYQVTLVASNAGGSASAGPVSFSTGTLPPEARTLAASIGTDSARLGGKVNPRNSPVEYQFEWGPNAAYGNSIPAEPALLPSADNSFHIVTADVSGLQSQTTYHYRVRARNTQTGEESLGADRSFTTLSPPAPPAPCPNASSRVGASTNLPDCRVYELATPGLNGAAPAGVWPGIEVEGVRADGDGIAFRAGSAPDQAAGATSTADTVLALRGAGGWSTRSLAAPTPEPSGTYFGSDSSTVGLSDDLTQAVVWSNQPLAGSSSPAGTNLYLRRADGSFQALTSIGAPQFTPGGRLVDASRDFGHLFLVSTVQQVGPDPVAGGNVYEWAGGQLRLVAILPGAGQEPAPDGGTLPEGALSAVSDDGGEVLFKATGLPGLYLRSDGQQTVEVSASQRTVEPDPNPQGEADAVGISADGSTVLFTSPSELTNDAYTGRTAGAANDLGRDLYAYDVQSEVLSDLTVDEKPADAGRGADVERVLGASQDASFVYFVASGDLAPGATSGERNLYVWHGGEIEYVGDDPVAEPAFGSSLYVTPDGRHAAFVSARPQTAYDNADQVQAYEYTYGAGLECGSCRPGGEPPAAGAAINGRALSDDGSRLFFQSADPLLPQVQNGLTNVYEYTEGEARLLTPGDGAAALLAGASADGDDVFIATFEQLAPQGPGAAFSIYDARVGAEVPPPTDAVGCQGEGCRGPGSAASEAATPGSAAFEAPGVVSISAPKSGKGPKATVRVIVPGPGKLTVSGRGVATLQKQVGKAGPVAVTISLRAGAQRKLRKLGRFRTEVEALFRPGPESISRATTSLKFEAVKPKRKGGA